MLLSNVCLSMFEANYIVSQSQASFLNGTVSRKRGRAQESAQRQVLCLIRTCERLMYTCSQTFFSQNNSMLRSEIKRKTHKKSNRDQESTGGFINANMCLTVAFKRLLN